MTNNGKIVTPLLLIGGLALLAMCLIAQGYHLSSTGRIPADGKPLHLPGASS